MAHSKFMQFTASMLLVELLLTTVRPALVYAAEAASKAASSPGAPAPAAVPMSESLTGIAKEHYENGKLLFENGDHAGALLKFQLAYDNAHDPRLLWNIAACEKQQRHYAKMAMLIEQYLKAGNSVITDAERSNAEVVLDTLRPFVGELQLQVNEPGATVMVDDAKVGTTPLPTLRVDMGARKLRVSKEGFEDWTSTQNINGGATVSVPVELRPIRHVGALQVLLDGGYDVLVDGKRVGMGNWTGELPSGTHSLDIQGKGMLPYHSDVVINDKQTNSVRVSLRPEPATVAPQSHNNYTWLWAAGGTLLAGGLATGAYFLFRPGDKRPDSLPGTMPGGPVQLP
jgi:hypothetical protein